MRLVGAVAGRLPWPFNVSAGDPFCYVHTVPYADNDAAPAYPHTDNYRHAGTVIDPRAHRLPKAAQ